MKQSPFNPFLFDHFLISPPIYHVRTRRGVPILIGGPPSCRGKNSPPHHHLMDPASGESWPPRTYVTVVNRWCFGVVGRKTPPPADGAGSRSGFARSGEDEDSRRSRQDRSCVFFFFVKPPWKSKETGRMARLKKKTRRFLTNKKYPIGEGRSNFF